MSVKEKLTALANKIRSYTGKTALLGLDDMAAEVDAVAVTMPNALIARSATNIVIPKGCSGISSYAFYYYNKKLKSVSVESTRLNGVYYCAFFHCDTLEEFYIADKCNIRRFGGRAFDKCSKLKLIDLSGYSGSDIPQLDSVDAFKEVHKDCVIIVPSGLYTQWISATNWSAIADIIYPSVECYLGNDGTCCVTWLPYLPNIYIPQSYKGHTIISTTYGGLGNRSIKTLIVDAEDIYLDSSGFKACTSLQSVVFKKTPSKISWYSFYNCTSCLVYDFSACTYIPKLGTNVFYGINDNAKILVPKKLYEEWKSATNWAEYADYIIAV